METIVNNPGLQHLAEKIFLNLDHQDLKICQQVNNSFKLIINNHMFWLRKFTKLSLKNQSDWINAIRITKDTDLEKPVISYLKKCSKNSRVNDLPCYIDKPFLTKFEELRSLAYNANTSDAFGRTPIFHAATEGDLVYLKILVLFADNPNASDVEGMAPIFMAALKGYEEIVRILAPLTDNPNAPCNNGWTPICLAASQRHT